MASRRQLKNKLQAVTNIKQMTKAMQLVAATKMRKSQERALGARPYALFAMDMLKHIVQHSRIENLANIFFRFKEEGKPQKIKKICLVVVTSDKGLAGAFNSQVLRKAARYLEEQKPLHIDIVAVGKKARDFFKKRQNAPVAEFLNFSDVLTLSDAEPLSQWIFAKYLAHEYGEIVFCSTQFISALNTKAQIRELLPLTQEALQKAIDGIVPEKGKYARLQARKEDSPHIAYLLEPSPKALFEELVIALIRVEILYFLYESNASEHSSRMIAMKNATDNAQNLAQTLVLNLNKLRQTAITQELTEISTAKEALTNE